MALFRINRKGMIDTVYLSQITPEPIADEIRRVMRLTNGHWKPVLKNGKPAQSDFFILPVQFELQDNCSTTNMNMSMLFDFGLEDNAAKYTLLPHIVIIGYTGISCGPRNYVVSPIKPVILPKIENVIFTKKGSLPATQNRNPKTKN